MSSKRKTYLRPFSFISEKDGSYLKKKSEAFSIGGGKRYFTKVEVIELGKNKCSKIFAVKDFLFEKKKDKRLIDLFNKIVEKRKLFQKKDFVIFGILNITPDSFSDGGDFFDNDKAFIAAKKMYQEGADFIDVGGESTRPGAEEVKDSDEIVRVLPIIQNINKQNIPISLDTRNSSTMRFGLLAGINIINDVSGLTHDSNSINVLKKFKSPFILMHMPGNPKNMMKKNNYKYVTLEVYDFFEERINWCLKNGIKKKNIIIDPGIGFGKDSNQNLEILKNISIFHSLGCLIMLGVSRKRFISFVTNEEDPKKRFPGSIAAALHAFEQGVQVFRVHDVKETKQSLEIFNKLEIN